MCGLPYRVLEPDLWSHMKRILLVPCILLLCISQSFAMSQQRPSILFLNSYHNGYRWSDNILQGFRETIEQSGLTPDMHIEYMDAKRYNMPEVRQAFHDLLKKKYGPSRFDVVVASDNDAFEFVMEYRDELFPNVPVVFCGVNGTNEGAFAGMPVTGVVENAGIQETLAVAFRIHPEAKRVVVIGDDSVTGLAIRHQVEIASTPFLNKVAFDYWREPKLEKILEQVKTLPSDTIVYYMPSYYRLNGHIYDPSEVLRMIDDACKRPIYSSWAFLLGYGIVGGRMASGLVEGHTTANMVLKILGGEQATQLPVLHWTQKPYQFDYLRMQEFNISEFDLPPGSKLINAPKVFYEVSKDLLWTSAVSFVLLSLALVMLGINIIRRKRIEAKIINQLSFQELLMNTIPQLICWKDAKQRYLGANRSFATFFGLDDPAALIHKTDYHIMKEGRFTEWTAAMDRDVLTSDQSQLRQRISLTDPSGEPVWLEVNKVPLHNAAGNVVGTLSTHEDITREMNLERQLLQSQKMEAIGALAGGVAHDFNNILTSIVNSTELALTDLDEESETANDLRRVLKASDRGKRLVQQILAFSRPSQEGFRPTDMAELFRETLAFLKPSLPRNITVHSSVEVATPHVLVDPTQIYQVLMNLCTNAFQAMRETGGELNVQLVELWLDAEQATVLDLIPGPFFKLTVADSGPGIDQEHLDKIFDPFFTTKGIKEGTGLGLAVVLGIVKNHGGTVRVESAPGSGAAFEIYIPSRDVAISDDLPLADAVSGQGRILFVEDDEDQLATVPRVLKSLGYDVEAAGGARRAMEMIDNGHAYDLVITDYDMPEANGVTLAKYVAQHRPGLPVVLVSGRGLAFDRSKQAVNIRRVLHKPFTKADLSEAVRSALR